MWQRWSVHSRGGGGRQQTFTGPGVWMYVGANSVLAFWFWKGLDHMYEAALMFSAGATGAAATTAVAASTHGRGTADQGSGWWVQARSHGGTQRGLLQHPPQSSRRQQGTGAPISC